MSKFGGAPQKCPRCNKTVYMAEEKIVNGKKYHKTCVKCKECNKALEPRDITNHDDEIYCNRCHSKLFGMKGYGYGQGAGVLSSEAPVAKSSNNSNSKNIKKNNNNNNMHNPPFCVMCGSGGQTGEFCTQCGQKPTANEPPPKPAAKPQVANDMCPKCYAPGQVKSFCTQCGYKTSPATNNNNAPSIAVGTSNNNRQKPTWQDDNASASCTKCGNKFSFTNRRHHCRKCGLLVCATCSAHKMELPWESGTVRVCNQCYQ